MAVKRKADWDQGGVRAVQLCQEIQKSLDNATATYSHPLLNDMQYMIKPTELLVEKARLIKERQEEIQAIYTIVAEPDNLDKLSLAERNKIANEKMAELITARDRFYVRSKTPGDDATWAHHCFKVTNSWLWHLLTYLEVPGMPSTNNSTEQEFGHIRTRLRRTTGRHNNHDLIYRHGEYIALTSTEETLQELTQRISSVKYPQYRKERERNRKNVAPLNMRKRVQKKAEQFFKGLNDMWAKIHS